MKKLILVDLGWCAAVLPLNTGKPLKHICAGLHHEVKITN